MRLKSLDISGFRAFSSRIWVDLDAEAVLVLGGNGRGKTSLFDAILWGLTGKIPRLNVSDRQLISAYSGPGEARVEMLMGADDQEWRLVRRSDGVKQYVSFEIDGEELSDTQAEAKLSEALWPDSIRVDEPFGTIANLLTRTVYLQQDLVSQFIDAEDDQSRFVAFSEIVGTGRINDLQIQLDRARTAWSTTTNLRRGDLEKQSLRLRELESRLTRLRGGTLSDETLGNEWREWWNDIRLHEIDVSAGEIHSPESSRNLENVLALLDARSNSISRRRITTAQLSEEIEQASTTPVPDMDALSEGVNVTKDELQLARTELEEAQSLAADERRRYLLAGEAREELAALARLAIRHLSERCPVCNQSYDVAATQYRLEQLMDSSPASDDSQTQELISHLANVVTERETVTREAEAKLAEAEELHRRSTMELADQDRRLQELGFDRDDGEEIFDRLQSHIRDLEGQLQNIAELKVRGERLVLAVASIAEQALINEVQSEADEARQAWVQLDEDVNQREKTRALASSILEGLRNTSTEVVAQRLAEIEGLLQKVYTRLDPHRSFRAVSLLTRVERGRGLISAQIEDRDAGIKLERPEIYLSSSQLNVLAVSIFLSMNLGMHELPLDCVILDDPLQSLDDVNLLGLTDLLRRIKGRRQLIISTHDNSMSQLLERKLRPVDTSDRTIVIEFLNWEKEGPEIRQRTLSPGEKVRIVA